MRTRGGTLVVIYGPPAAGKLTVGTGLAKLTGFKLFHNHLTVNAVRELFEFLSPEYIRAVQRVRLDLLTQAAECGIDVVFTYTTRRLRTQPFTGPDAFIRNLREAVVAAGGAAHFVHLVPPPDVLESRVEAESRTMHRKLDTVARLRHQLEEYEFYDEIDPGSLTIDNSHIPPDEAARQIADAFSLQR